MRAWWVAQWDSSYWWDKCTNISERRCLENAGENHSPHGGAFEGRITSVNVLIFLSLFATLNLVMCREGRTYLKLNILMHPELEKLEQEVNPLKLCNPGELSYFLLISVFPSDLVQLYKCCWMWIEIRLSQMLIIVWAPSYLRHYFVLIYFLLCLIFATFLFPFTKLSWLQDGIFCLFW